MNQKCISLYLFLNLAVLGGSFTETQELSETMNGLEEDAVSVNLQTQETDKNIVIYDTIRKYSEIYGVNYNLAVDLAHFESNLDPKAVNIYPNEHGTSTAGGLYMFIDKTWEEQCEGDKYNPEDNAKCAMRIIGEGNIRPWTADKKVQRFLVQKDYVGCWNFSKNDCFLIE